jgi:hypothetical protein
MTLSDGEIALMLVFCKKHQRLETIEEHEKEQEDKT